MSCCSRSRSSGSMLRGLAESWGSRVSMVFLRMGKGSSAQGKHRYRRPAVARLEDEPDGLPDADLVEVASDDVGHHRRTFGERHIGDGVRDRRPAHHAVGVDRAVARGLLQFGLVAEADRAHRPRIIIHRPAGGALADHQLASRGGVPKGLGLEIGLRRLDLALLALHRAHSLSMMTVAAPCLVPSEPPVPCANARSQFLTCTAGCASPRNWRTASTTLVRPPRLDG